MYYVYILQCSDSSYYVGVTNNLKRRFHEHQSGLNKKAYTFSRRPLQLKFKQEFKYINDAISFEKQIKRWSRAKKEALINGDFDMLTILSECRNATHYKYK